MKMKGNGIASTNMGIREGARAILINAPQEAVQASDPSRLDLAKSLTGKFDYIHLFTKSQADMKARFPRLKAHLQPSGMLWVSWPKNKQLGTDLTLGKIIEIGYDYGPVESKAISIDETWSAIKFTHPRAGKVYKNRFGKLNS